MARVKVEIRVPGLSAQQLRDAFAKAQTAIDDPRVAIGPVQGLDVLEFILRGDLEVSFAVDTDEITDE